MTIPPKMVRAAIRLCRAGTMPSGCGAQDPPDVVAIFQDMDAKEWQKAYEVTCFVSEIFPPQPAAFHQAPVGAVWRSR